MRASARGSRRSARSRRRRRAVARSRPDGRRPTRATSGVPPTFWTRCRWRFDRVRRPGRRPTTPGSPHRHRFPSAFARPRHRRGDRCPHRRCRCGAHRPRYRAPGPRWSRRPPPPRGALRERGVATATACRRRARGGDGVGGSDLDRRRVGRTEPDELPAAVPVDPVAHPALGHPRAGHPAAGHPAPGYAVGEQFGREPAVHRSATRAAATPGDRGRRSAGRPTTGGATTGRPTAGRPAGGAGRGSSGRARGQAAGAGGQAGRPAGRGRAARRVSSGPTADARRSWSSARATSIDSVAGGGLVQRVARNGRTVSLAGAGRRDPDVVDVDPGRHRPLERGRGAHTGHAAGRRGRQDAAVGGRRERRRRRDPLHRQRADPAARRHGHFGRSGLGATGRAHCGGPPVHRRRGRGPLGRHRRHDQRPGDQSGRRRPRQPRLSFGRGSTGSLVGTTLLRNSTGLVLAGSQGVRLQDVTVDDSVQDGIVLRGDRATALSGVKAERSGNNGVLVSGAGVRPADHRNRDDREPGLRRVGRGAERRRGEQPELVGGSGRRAGTEPGHQQQGAQHHHRRRAERGVPPRQHDQRRPRRDHRIGGRTGILEEKTTSGLHVTGSTHQHRARGGHGDRRPQHRARRAHRQRQPHRDPGRTRRGRGHRRQGRRWSVAPTAWSPPGARPASCSTA